MASYTPGTPTPIKDVEVPIEELAPEQQLEMVNAARDRKAIRNEEAAEERVQGDLHAMRVHENPSKTEIWVQCKFPGYTSLWALYNIGQPVLKRQGYRPLAERKHGERMAEFAIRFREWVEDTADWTSFFLVAVDGWDFKDEEGNAVPAPDGQSAEPFEWLWENHQDLASWFAFIGYDLALVASVKN